MKSEIYAEVPEIENIQISKKSEKEFKEEGVSHGSESPTETFESETPTSQIETSDDLQQGSQRSTSSEYAREWNREFNEADLMVSYDVACDENHNSDLTSTDSWNIIETQLEEFSRVTDN